MKERKIETMPINKEKLIGRIKELGYSVAQLSEEMGYSRSHLGNIIHGNKSVHYKNGIPKRIALLLEQFGIRYEEYMPDPEPEPEETLLPWEDTGKTVTVKLDADQLAFILMRMEVIIKESIYSEVKKAWNE